ncbi:asparagine synthetase B family protein [candidate division CSSED10-310 bacterium]|uniref:asparagine synthase (glutamine-hydrolyzing) n=1 Tax=candidate division CSSED10-310 bacterium TaxID=2855610 RepID=A0ABV6YT20_UNCC1
MSAIFGFSGKQDRQLQQVMAESLSHRGSLLQPHDKTTCQTIGLLSHHTPEIRAKLGEGFYSEGNQAIALAGYITSSGPIPSLPQLLAAYRLNGPLFVSKLRGAFLIAIRDGDIIHLARDGAGVRTGYYACHGGRFLFAAEPKAILAVPNFPRRLRAASLAQYLTFSFVPGAATMLEGLYEILPGHVVTCDGRSEPEVRRYFMFEDETLNVDQTDEYWLDRFRQQFAEAVSERLFMNEPVGIFLSGGIDSSVVTAAVSEQFREQPVLSYAIHFGPDYPNELEFARLVADCCGTNHEEILIQPKHFLPRLRQIIWHLDDPIGDPITVPNFELAAKVSQTVKWVFNGEGGDPCFGGPKNLPMLLNHWYGGVERDHLFREKMYLQSYRRCYEELSRLLTPEIQAQYDVSSDLEQLLTPFFNTAVPSSFLSKLIAINIRLKGAHLILPKVERMTGACGLTPLSPLFDERLIRLSFEMPSRMKLHRGVEKIILKKAYENKLPRVIIERPKSGMRVPVHFWFQKDLKRYASKILNRRQLKKSGIFNWERVKQLLDYNTVEGPGRYGIRLWMLITFEIWRRIFIEGEAP